MSAIAVFFSDSKHQGVYMFNVLWLFILVYKNIGAGIEVA